MKVENVLRRHGLVSIKVENVRTRGIFTLKEDRKIKKGAKSTHFSVLLTTFIKEILSIVSMKEFTLKYNHQRRLALPL